MCPYSHLCSWIKDNDLDSNSAWNEYNYILLVLMCTVSFPSQMSWIRYGWQPCSEPTNPVSITPLYEEHPLWQSWSLICWLCSCSQALKVLWPKQTDQTHLCFPSLDVSRFLGARTITPFPWWPWRSQAGGQAGVVGGAATAQGSRTAPGALARKSSSCKPQVGTWTRTATPSPHWWQGTPLSSSASSEDWVSDSCSFIWFLSVTLIKQTTC